MSAHIQQPYEASPMANYSHVFVPQPAWLFVVVSTPVMLPQPARVHSPRRHRHRHRGRRHRNQQPEAVPPNPPNPLNPVQHAPNQRVVAQEPGYGTPVVYYPAPIFNPCGAIFVNNMPPYNPGEPNRFEIEPEPEAPEPFGELPTNDGAPPGELLPPPREFS
ncbi:uncharacterized protein LOC126266453 [Aethina tumida]|uniref:uncharacterized protein LOC126266453 n=1 Tax=Aethina tumida TaxID=116153 RepID=UPI00214720D0|nr:uncharacterized protein LOC126266453 [Aethina tumida]